MKKIRYISFLLCLFFSGLLMAQKEINQHDVSRDDLGDVSDQFQEHFFEALAQEAIENPEKAITALQKCLELDQSNFAALFLMGKNQAQTDAFQSAEPYFKKALKQAKPDQEKYVHVHLYRLYIAHKAFQNAIVEAKILAEQNSDYQRELINLYHITEQFDKALEQIKIYDQKFGYSEARDQQRMAIYKANNTEDAARDYFKMRLNRNTQDRGAYKFLNRIYLSRNAFEEVITLSKKAEKELPEFAAILPPMALAYIKSEQTDLAKKYARKALNNPMIAEKEKVEVINAYRIFAEKNADIKRDLIDLLDQAITSEKNTSSQAELGNFYKDKDPENALSHYRKALRNKPNDFKLYKEILNLELYLGKFEEARKTSQKALEVYPSQGIFYYTNAVALFELDAVENALNQLDMSLSLLIEDTELELQIHRLYLKIYQAQNNTEKGAFHQKEIQRLKEKK